MLPGRIKTGTAGGTYTGLCGFNSTGESYAITTGGGLVKVFDTVDGTLRQQVGGGNDAGDGHLSAEYRALAWTSAPAKTPGKSKKKTKANVTSSAEVLALGCANGDVLGWDVALGELQWRAAGCHDGGVTSLAFSSAGGGVLYSSGNDAQICELSTASGTVQAKWKAGKHALGCIAVSPDGTRLLAGSATLSLWDLASRERLAKMSGHMVSARITQSIAEIGS